VVGVSSKKQMQLAHYYEGRKDPALNDTTEAYSALYTSVLTYEKALVSGDYAKLSSLADSMAVQVKANAPHLSAYVKIIGELYVSPQVATQELLTTLSLYQDITGERLMVPRPTQTGVHAR